MPVTSPRRASRTSRLVPPEFRRKVLDFLGSGRNVADVARDPGISKQTIYTWRHQDRIGWGIEPGLTAEETAELTAAKKRIAELDIDNQIGCHVDDVQGGQNWRSTAGPASLLGKPSPNQRDSPAP